MTKELLTINSILAVIGATVTNALGGWDLSLQTLAALIVLDYLTGIVIAILLKQLSSEIGFKGLAKKGFIIAIVYLGTLADRAIGTDFLRTLVIMFYIANEGISILENAGRLGVPYPAAIKNILVQLKQKNEEEGAENVDSD